MNDFNAWAVDTCFITPRWGGGGLTWPNVPDGVGVNFAPCLTRETVAVAGEKDGSQKPSTSKFKEIFKLS